MARPDRPHAPDRRREIARVLAEIGAQLISHEIAVGEIVPLVALAIVQIDIKLDEEVQQLERAGQTRFAVGTVARRAAGRDPLLAETIARRLRRLRARRRMAQ
jgi:hypothetical protein